MCAVDLEFTAWDSILRVPRVRVRIRVWVRLTVTVTLNLPQSLPLLTWNKSNRKLPTNIPLITFPSKEARDWSGETRNFKCSQIENYSSVRRPKVVISAHSSVRPIVTLAVIFENSLVEASRIILKGSTIHRSTVFMRKTS